MAKKSGGSGCIVVAAVILGAVAAIPKEVWVMLGIAGLIGVAIYFWAKGKSSKSGLHPFLRTFFLARKPLYSANS